MAAERQQLTAIRLIWGAMILGELIFAGVVVFRPLLAQPLLGDSFASVVLLYAVWVALAVALPVGYFARNQIYKAHWREHTVTPTGYFKGNLVLLVLMDAVALFSLVTALLAGSFWPYGGPAILALLVQVLNYPTGKPLRPHPPSFEQ